MTGHRHQLRDLVPVSVVCVDGCQVVDDGDGLGLTDADGDGLGRLVIRMKYA